MATKALARRSKTKTRTITKTKWRTRTVKAKTVRRRASSLLAGTPKKAAAAAAIGYVMGMPGMQEQVAKLPQLGNRTMTAGLALYFANKFAIKNSYAAAAADALIIVGSYELGATGFGKHSDRQGYIEGGEYDDDGHVDVSGTIGEDDAEFEDDDLDEE